MSGTARGCAWSGVERHQVGRALRAGRWDGAGEQVLHHEVDGARAEAVRAVPDAVDGQQRAARQQVVDADVPDVDRSSSMIMRMVDDLPAPFGPRNPVTVPGTIVKLRECTPVVSP
jgi:hypothetical protein